MKIREMARRALILAAVASMWASSARAADMPPPAAQAAPVPDTEFRLTPFFWAAGLNGTVGTRRTLPTVDVDIQFKDILRNLDFAAMLAGEYRNGRWGLLADLTYVAISVERDRDLALRAPGFTSATLTSKTFTATATGFYRFYDSGSFTADLLAGGRVWSISTDLDLLIAGALAVSAGSTQSWIDPVAGVRVHANLGNGFGLSAYGDIGAGSSRLTWQLRATLDYAFNQNWSAHIGYRHLAVDYRRGGFVYDTSLSGPIAGVSYRF
ncbi:outer membrane protein [Bosea sp. LjRoot237]|uniref:outer membrane protein n=1 Tax=Bosea sp. LjRoot237 TaxID=3342292 RepID=UPI003ECE4FEE